MRKTKNELTSAIYAIYPCLCMVCSIANMFVCSSTCPYHSLYSANVSEVQSLPNGLATRRDSNFIRNRFSSSCRPIRGHESTPCYSSFPVRNNEQEMSWVVLYHNSSWDPITSRNQVNFQNLAPSGLITTTCLDSFNADHRG